MKKAQMEMLGIVIVVVLLVFGLTFFIASTLKPAEDIGGRFTQAELPETIITTLVEINSGTECGEVKMADLFEDCAMFSGRGGYLSCGSESSCQYINRTVDLILDQTVLRTKEFGYHFYIEKNDVYAINITRNCTQDMDIETGTQPLPDNIKLVLEICK